MDKKFRINGKYFHIYGGIYGGTSVWNDHILVGMGGSGIGRYSPDSDPEENNLHRA